MPKDYHLRASHQRTQWNVRNSEFRRYEGEVGNPPALLDDQVAKARRKAKKKKPKKKATKAAPAAGVVKPEVLIGFLNRVRDRAPPTLKKRIPPFTRVPGPGNREAVHLLEYGVQTAARTDTALLAEFVNQVGETAVRALCRIILMGATPAAKTSLAVLQMVKIRTARHATDTVISASSNSDAALAADARRLLQRLVPRPPSTRPPKPQTSTPAAPQMKRQSTHAQRHPPGPQRPKLPPTSARRDRPPAPSEIDRHLCGRWLTVNSGANIEFTRTGLFLRGTEALRRYRIVQDALVQLMVGPDVVEQFVIRSISPAELKLESDDGAVFRYSREGTVSAQLPAMPRTSKPARRQKAFSKNKSKWRP